MVLASANHCVIRCAVQPQFGLIEIFDGLGQVVIGVLFDVTFEWRRRGFQELQHPIHFPFRMLPQIVVVQNDLREIKSCHERAELSFLFLAGLDAVHQCGSREPHGREARFAEFQVPLSPVLKQPPGVQGRDGQFECVASRHQDDSKTMFSQEFGKVLVVVYIFQLRLEPNCHRLGFLTRGQQIRNPFPLRCSSKVHQFFPFRDHVGMALQRRRKPARTGSARKQNGKWVASFDGSPLLGGFGDGGVDALEFAGQCSQAESGFIDLSSVRTDSLSHLWIDELGNGLGEFIGCMFRDQQAVDSVFDLEWDTSMAGRDHRSPRRHGLNDDGWRPFFIPVPRSHTGDQSEVGHFKPLADVIVIDRAQECHGVGRVEFVNQPRVATVGQAP